MKNIIDMIRSCLIKPIPNLRKYLRPINEHRNAQEESSTAFLGATCWMSSKWPVRTSHCWICGTNLRWLRAAFPPQHHQAYLLISIHLPSIYRA